MLTECNAEHVQAGDECQEIGKMINFVVPYVSVSKCETVLQPDTIKYILQTSLISGLTLSSQLTTKLLFYNLFFFC